MHNSMHQDGGSRAQAVPPTPDSINSFLQSYPGHNFVPLLELVSSHSSDGYEAFFNQVAELVCRHFGHGEWDNAYLLRMTQELFRFRDAFRGMRNGDGWE